MFPVDEGVQLAINVKLALLLVATASFFCMLYLHSPRPHQAHRYGLAWVLARLRRRKR